MGDMLGCISMTENLPSMHKALGLILSMEKKEECHLQKHHGWNKEDVKNRITLNFGRYMNR
jgi:hypothetical protein